MFMSWLAASGHENDLDVKSLAQDVAKLFQERDESHMCELCDAVDHL